MSEEPIELEPDHRTTAIINLAAERDRLASELQAERRHADDLVALVERVGEVKTPGDIRGVGWWLHAGEVLQRHRERRSSGEDG